MAVDRITDVRFDGDMMELIGREVDREWRAALREGREPTPIEDNDFPWLDFQIQAVVLKQRKWFPCRFKICTDDGGFAVEVETDCKGIAAPRFQALLAQNQEKISSEIVQFALDSFQSMAEASSLDFAGSAVYAP